jgi:hypothetical protein
MDSLIIISVQGGEQAVPKEFFHSAPVSSAFSRTIPTFCPHPPILRFNQVLTIASPRRVPPDDRSVTAQHDKTARKPE